MAAQDDAAPHALIEVDSSSDVDSALGEDQSTYTTSLRSSLLQSVSENGRGYHKYREGQYMLPEDEREQERLDMQHEMFLRTLGGKLYLAPIEQDIREAIDLGTGTGIWAVDLADQHPDAQVLGTDLSPIQPNYAPPNCKWEIDDFENEWTFKQKFDLVHARMMLASVTDFPRLFKQTYDALQPGGWFELQDLCMPMTADDESMKGSALQEWNKKFVMASDKMGRDPTQARRYKEWMVEFGFENVHESVFKWPINSWAKDKALKEIGRWNLINMLEGLDGFTMRLFTKFLDMTFEEVATMLVDVRKDLYNKNIHCYWPIYVVYGRKPTAATGES